MATKFKKGNIWYIRTKAEGGRWINVSCGKSANSNDAELIRKNYDAAELNRKHGLVVREVQADLFEQLAIYREQEITRSNTGRQKGRKTIQRYQAIIDNLKNFLEERGWTKYADITSDRMKLFFDDLIKKERSASTITKHRQEFINFFKWSIARHHCKESPMGEIRNPKREKKPPRFFTEGELSKIFSDAKPPYADIFKFLYLSGMRIGEVGNSEISHYLPHLQAIRIPVMEGNKTKREEILPLNIEAVEIIERQAAYRAQFGTPDAQTYLFLNMNGLKLDDANIYRHLKVVLGHCKITGCSPHTFRHTCASHLAIKGVSLYIIRDILRHASIRETEIYAHLSKDSVRKAVGLISTSFSTSKPQQETS